MRRRDDRNGSSLRKRKNRAWQWSQRQGSTTKLISHSARLRRRERRTISELHWGQMEDPGIGFYQLSELI
jgi:hypothetical protein